MRKPMRALVAAALAVAFVGASVPANSAESSEGYVAGGLKVTGSYSGCRYAAAALTGPDYAWINNENGQCLHVTVRHYFEPAAAGRGFYTGWVKNKNYAQTTATKELKSANFKFGY